MEAFMSETARLADQIRRAFEGDAWHGDSIKELLTGVTAETAAAKPIKDAHSIWELALHIAAWDDAVLRRIGGAVVGVGAFGRNHARVYHQLAQQGEPVTLAAVVDPDVSRADAIARE